MPLKLQFNKILPEVLMLLFVSCFNHLATQLCISPLANNPLCIHIWLMYSYIFHNIELVLPFHVSFDDQIFQLFLYILIYKIITFLITIFTFGDGWTMENIILNVLILVKTGKTTLQNNYKCLSRVPLNAVHFLKR